MCIFFVIRYVCGHAPCDKGVGVASKVGCYTAVLYDNTSVRTYLFVDSASCDGSRSSVLPGEQAGRRHAPGCHGLSYDDGLS